MVVTHRDMIGWSMASQSCEHRGCQFILGYGLSSNAPVESIVSGQNWVVSSRVLIEAQLRRCGPLRGLVVALMTFFTRPIRDGAPSVE